MPFVLLLPIAVAPGAALANAAGAATQLRLAVALLVANGLLTIGISVALFATVRRTSEVLALWLVVGSVVMLVTQAVDNTFVMSLLSLSRAAAASGGVESHWPAAALATATVRGWSHTTAILAIDGWILLFYLALVRAALVPRMLVAIGLVTVMLHGVGIPLRSFLGLGPMAALGMPMALSHLLLAAWLLGRGVAPAAPAATVG